MGLLIEKMVLPAGLTLAAAASAAAAAVDLIEVSRDEDETAEALRFREVAETLADALQSVLSIEHAGDPALEELTGDARDRHTAVGDLLAACSRFVEGWA